MHRFVPRTAVVAVAAGCLSLVGAGIARADVGVTDPPGDAPAHIDIVKAHFHNGASTIAARISVRKVTLAPAYFAVSFAPENSPDVGFIATSSLHANSTLHNRLVFFDDIGARHVISCDVQASWNTTTDVVRIGVPRSCVLGVTGTMFMGSQSGVGTSLTRDHSPYRDVDFS